MRKIATVLTVALGLSLLVAPPAAPFSEVSDTLSIPKDDTDLTNVEAVARLDEETPSPGRDVIISRDDEFADALASGLLQRNGPMLAVPTDGPLPDVVAERIAARNPDRAIILGGTAAVGPAVEQSLRDLGLGVTRLQGGSRFDTAIAIAAAEAPDADTIMLARAFPSPGSTDPSQGYADTLAAGGVSARNGWPVLLTQTEVLTGPTRDYIAASGASRVLILGGTAAISQAVQNEVSTLVTTVSRVAGSNRAETAVELAKVSGDDSARDVSQVIMVEGSGTNAFTRGTRQGGAGGPDSWAPGFAAAHRAFTFDSPILLTTAGVVPPESAAFLAPGIAGDAATAPLVTCTMTGPACEEGRQAAGLPAAVEVTVTPDGGTLAPGDQLQVTFTGYDGQATVDGSCVDGPFVVDGGTGLTLPAADPVPSPCEVLVSGISLSTDTVQTEVVVFNDDVAQPPPTGGLTTIHAEGFDGQGTGFTAVETPAGAAHSTTGSPPTVTGGFLRLQSGARNHLVNVGFDQAAPCTAPSQVTVTFDYRITSTRPDREGFNIGDGFAMYLLPTDRFGSAGQVPAVLAERGQAQAPTDPYAVVDQTGIVAVGFNTFDNGEGSNNSISIALSGPITDIDLDPTGYDVVNGLDGSPGAFQGAAVTVDFAADTITVLLTDPAGATTVVADAMPMGGNVVASDVRLAFGARSGDVQELTDLDDVMMACS